MDSKFILSTVRHLAMTIGMILVTRGVTTGETVEVVAGALASITSLSFSFWYKRTSTTADQFAGFVRQVLSAIGGVGIQLHGFDPQQVETIIGFLTTLSGLLFSFQYQTTRGP